MKIIEGLKLRKELAKKAEDLRSKISGYCADADFETPTYTDQAGQVREWLQAHWDVVKEMSNLSAKIARTNLATIVEIELGGTRIRKSIQEWIIRRKELSGLELLAWKSLTDRNIKEGSFQKTSGEMHTVKLRRYYDPKVRDSQIAILISEPSKIDGILEVVNATTELVETL